MSKRGESIPWDEIKRRMREQAMKEEGLLADSSSTRTTSPPSGDAPTTAASKADPSGKAEASPAPSSATPAGATEISAPPRDPSGPSTDASDTPTASNGSTDWGMSPSGFVEMSWPESILPLSGLPTSTAAQLAALAEGRGEPVQAIVHEIAEFLVTAEDERAEGRLDEAVTFYVDNYLLR